jgi:hypothetical protein
MGAVGLVLLLDVGEITGATAGAVILEDGAMTGAVLLLFDGDGAGSGPTRTGDLTGDMTGVVIGGDRFSLVNKPHDTREPLFE